jgi:cell division protein FtsW (lipid II flippase)
VTVVAGETVNGARLWLRLGPIRFQPSEIARLCLAAFVATYLYDRRHLVGAPWRVRSFDLPPAPYLLPLGAAVLAAVGVLVLQNDLGMSALVALGALAALLSVQHAKSFVVAAMVFLLGAMLASYMAVPRVRDRVEGWLDPWRDPAGRGFQFVQADFGLAGGGIAGQTSPLATPRVPELHTDLILVAIGSELGIVVAVAILTLSGLLVCRCVAAALRAADGFRSLLGLSLAALIGIQVLLIAGGTLRVLPLTGLTYPLVSYGGTAMVVTLFALGAIVGIGSSGETRD